MSALELSDMNTPSPRQGRRFGKFLTLGGLVLILVAGALIYPQMEFPESTGEVLDVPLVKAVSGPLTISVTESGVLRSTQVEILKCEVWGETTIISIIEEGTAVKAGDLLIELDSSGYEDYLINVEISVQNAKARLINATEGFEVLKQQVKAAMLQAEVRLKLAELDLEKYRSEGGEFQQQVERADAIKTNAENDLSTAADRYEWSEKLMAEGFITKQDWDRDRLAEVKARLRVTTTQNSIDMLKRFSRERALELLQSNFDQAKFALKKEEHRTQSNLVNAEAGLYATQVSMEREQEKMARVIEYIEKCKIVAPVDGMVVYATSVGGGMRGRGPMQPLGEGSEVHQRQDLIRLPATEGGMTVDVKLHDSVLDKVEVGQQVRLTAEALPGRSFEGRLETIGVLPDASLAFINPDLKVYRSTITVIGSMDGLRPGMSCQAEILVDYHEDAVLVPVQSVLRMGAEKAVHVMTKDGPVKRVVETGANNNRMVQIKSGLQAGESILLVPPPVQWAASGSIFGEIDQELLKEARQAAVNAAANAAAQPKSGEGKKGPGGMAARFDKDGDGKISKDEFPNAAKFDELDKDGDGFLTASEIPAAPAGGKRGGGQGQGGGSGGGGGARG